MTRDDALDRLSAALRRLPEIDRAPVLLTLYGRPHAKIAEALGLNVSNVEVRFSRAKAQLTALVSNPIPS